MFVMTIDQRGSRIHGDKVPQLLETLAGVTTVLPFERSVGDEIQAVLDDPDAVVEVALRALRAGNWYVGIGVGEVEAPLPKSSREAAGPAFIAAREAVESAKKVGVRVPLRVAGGTERSEWTQSAEAVLVLLGEIVRGRSEAEWRVLDALDASPGLAQKDIAAQLDVSPQAVNKAIRRSGLFEERNGRRAAALLLRRALQP